MRKEKDASWRSQVSRSAWNKEECAVSELTPSTKQEGARSSRRSCPSVKEEEEEEKKEVAVKKRKKEEDDGGVRWWETWVGVCGRVRGGEGGGGSGGESVGGREGNEQTTGKKSAASKAAPPRLNFGIYRTKIVV